MKVCQKQHPIFTSLSPNVERDDLALVFKLIFSPRQWQKGPALGALEAYFKRFLGVKHAISLNSGRSGFLAILRALNLGPGKEVLVQGLTCNALVNPIIWSDLKPIYVDISRDTLNTDPHDLIRKMGPKSRVVVVQHTFGLPAEMERISAICQRHNLILIEDCAHSLGATYRFPKARPLENLKVGAFGKAAFFSFGRDKIISSVYGGMVVTNDDVLAEKIRQFQNELTYPSQLWILQQLLHPILTKLIIMPLYSFLELGRWLLIFFQKTKILSKAVHKKEKRGERPNYLPQKMPNVLATLALHQLKKIDRFIAHQKQIAQIYNENLKNLDVILPPKKEGRVYVRYPVLIKSKNSDEILKKARKQKIFLDDGWRKTPIVPLDTDQEKMGYVPGTCPVAERVAKQILNLPTHINISKQNAQRIVQFIENLSSENLSLGNLSSENLSSENLSSGNLSSKVH